MRVSSIALESILSLTPQMETRSAQFSTAMVRSLCGLEDIVHMLDLHER